MKQILFAAAFLLTAGSFANTQTITGFSEFKVVSAKFSEAHIVQPGDATLSIDYSKSQIQLFVESENFCPPNMKCAAFVPAPLIVELPITSITIDSCGIRTIIAKKDLRPADGILKLLTIKDASQMTCETFVGVQSEAQYQTTSVDRFKKNSVNNISTMTLALNLPAKTEAKTILKFQQFSGFSLRPSKQVLTIDENGKVLSTEILFHDKSQHQVEIAQLSVVALKKLKSQIASVKEETQLVDENENGPLCQDAPSSSISIVSNDKEIKIYSFENCHTSQSYDGQATSLVRFMLGLISLAN